MFCQECGAELQKDAKFCPNCGKAYSNELTLNQNELFSCTAKQPLKKLSIEREFHFAYISKTFNLISYHADISSDGIVLKINRYNKFFRAIKYNQKTELININDINNVIIEEKRPAIYVLWLITSLLMLIAAIFTFQPMYALIAFVCIFFWSKKDKNLVIFHKYGILKIKESIGIDSDAQSLVDFLHQRNPDCVKTYFIKE